MFSRLLLEQLVLGRVAVNPSMIPIVTFLKTFTQFPNFVQTTFNDTIKSIKVSTQMIIIYINIYPIIQSRCTAVGFAFGLLKYISYNPMIISDTPEPMLNS
ncbi:hypothetical protein EGR_07853 [Echinococcus granulosus]|uniref:Uncharacterized protein n=1 Tax=Echinococcus granulosus TaxID=6210 RepID=W6UGS4_ECHGR|nr:hypothetical protein EGR_07853 [Echinococcus granulosus]EUB57317.1 hypothetical protein EGR_07853 [Echinococcus granulosus]